MNDTGATGVAWFKYPMQCLSHNCTRHWGPVNMALHTTGRLPAKVHFILRNRLREHFGGHAALALVSPPNERLQYLLPRTEPSRWFHA